MLHQHHLGCLAPASYLVGDERSGRAVVVDPHRDVDEYLAEAELGLRIEEVILTHIHADFVSGDLGGTTGGATAPPPPQRPGLRQGFGAAMPGVPPCGTAPGAP